MRDRWEGGGGGGGRSRYQERVRACVFRGGGSGHLCEAKQLGAIKPSFAVGTIHSEAGVGSSSPSSAAPFISASREDPVNAMGVVKVKHAVFCWAAPLLTLNIPTANEKKS